ncbi:cupin domain-containing protein [Haloarcula sp. GH36]|uniref:cupin domain-containing protein n=1 Tax=Haloarcula montana TaxID=3111776 RepID=UPI002D783FC3|nr:cupin domain-containing protein [Haloarcula sp. GH36]
MSDGPVNAADLEWTDYDNDDRQFKRKQLGAAAGGANLGTSLYEIPAGKRTWPPHSHYGNEEAMFVLDGTGRLFLGIDGEEHPLEPGDYVALPTGEEHTHEVEAGDDGLRLLVVSEMNDPDITYMPGRGAVHLFAGAPPGGDADERDLSTMLDLDATLDYWEE